MRTRLRSKVTLLFLAFAVAIFAVAGTAMALTTDGSGTTSLSPTIQSDKADYAPGETVTLTGSSWQPGESVHINVNDDQGKTWSYDSNPDVTADANGNISHSFNLPDWFVATYKVTATGEQSGTATTTFTDGQLRAVAANLSSTQQWTVTSTRYTGNNCDGSVVGPATGQQTVLNGATQSGNLSGGSGTNSVMLQASNPSSTGGKAFDKWTWTNTNAPVGTVTGSATSTSTCVDAVKLAANDLVYTANYTTIAATTLAVDAASGTYGGTADLTGKLTSGGSGVTGKTISLKLNGNSVGTATTQPDDPATTTVNEAGTFKLTGASLSGINAGTYLGSATTPGVSASFAGDSGFSASNGSNNLTVNKATLTVTANDDSREYGAANPAFTASYSGFKNGENLGTSGVTGSPSLTTAATATSPVGDYTITAAQGTLASNNYDFAFVNGTLHVTKATLTVTADDTTKVLGAPNPAFTATITGFKNGQTLATSGVTGSPSFTTTATTTSPIGNYPITPAVGTLASNNYTFSFANGTLKIQYASAGTCLGSPGHQILQPINADGSSAFKQGSTVPAKFRVCDANGNSIGTAGVVTSFKLIKTVSGLDAYTVDEPVISTTPDTAFRWSATDQQWIFNINTKSLATNKTYTYRITLADGTFIDFEFGLKK